MSTTSPVSPVRSLSCSIGGLVAANLSSQDLIHLRFIRERSKNGPVILKDPASPNPTAKRLIDKGMVSFSDVTCGPLRTPTGEKSIRLTAAGRMILSILDTCTEATAEEAERLAL